MTSENAVNSIPPSANRWALTTVLRGAWGFEGYVTGDCGAVDAAFAPYPTTHNFTRADLPEHQFPHYGHGYRPPAGVTGLESAGFDVDCKRGPSQAVGTPTDQDAALRHLWAIQFRLGRFDPLSASPHNNLSYQQMGSAQHQQLALEAARQGMVLLKNAGSALPLKPGLKIAVIGPFSQVTAELKSDYADAGDDSSETIFSSIAAANTGGTTSFEQVSSTAMVVLGGPDLVVVGSTDMVVLGSTDMVVLGSTDLVVVLLQTDTVLQGIDGAHWGSTRVVLGQY